MNRLLKLKNVIWLKTISAVLVILVCLLSVACGNRSFNSNHALAESKKHIEKVKNYKIESVEIPGNAVNEFKQIIYQNGRQNDAPSCDQVMEGTAWGENIGIPVDWSCKNVKNRNVCFKINGLRFLDSLYLQYDKTKDAKLGRRIMEYIIDWVRQNPEYTDANKKSWPWHDDATASRVLRMSFYYATIGQRLCSDEERMQIKKSLLKQVDLLMSDTFYTKHHNHGMHQDMALLAYVLLTEEDIKQQKKILQTALSRTGEYIDYVFTDDGIHREHSPDYARSVLQDANRMISLTKNISPAFFRDTENIVHKAYKYLIYIQKPDNTWPSIGDSSPGRHSRPKNTGNIEAGDAAVFPSGGYAVFRSSWEKDATWIMFLAATHSSAHKHGDDLSFLAYHKGDLFVEGGKRNYNYKDRMTAWVYSGFAHNVLIVNDKPFPVKTNESGRQVIYPRALKTGITDYRIDGDVKTVTGRQVRFENVDQERTLCWDKKKNVLYVTDDLHVKENLDATFLFHVAKGVVVKELKDGWEFYRDRDIVAEMHVESSEHVELETITGQEGRYPYCTWIFDGNDQPGFGSLLLIKVKCKQGRYLVKNKIELK